MSVCVYCWADKIAGHRRCASEAAGPLWKASKRQVTMATFDKWQQEYAKDHQTLSWLRCNLKHDKRHTAASFYCAVCRKYEDSLKPLKCFSRAWITGCTNQKVRNFLDHAASEVHKVAMTRKRADATKAKRQVCCSVFHDRPLFVDVGQRYSSRAGGEVWHTLRDG